MKHIQTFVLASFFVLVFLPAHAKSDPPPDAPPTIAPGQTKVWTLNADGSDGGETTCSGLVDNPLNLPPPPSASETCLLPRYGVLPYFNKNDAALNFVKVTVLATATSTIPAHASSAVYNEFTVGGSGGTAVDAQIAVTFDYIGKIAGLSVYRDELSLSLVVENITTGRPVGTLPLFGQGRDGDQGVTDVAGTAEIVPVDDASNGFIVKLRRGHTYRVGFVIEADNFGAGFVGGEAQWSKMVVTIDENEHCETASQQRKIQGCNGLDDDCDGLSDECDEDAFGPQVHIDHSVSRGCYDTAEEATLAVAAAVSAADDCGAVTIAPANFNGRQCEVPVDVTASDDCGNSTTAGAIVRIDGDGPSISIAPAVADVCYASIAAAEQTVLDAATISDNCDPAEDVAVAVRTSVQECALQVRVSAVDECGNESTAAVTLRVDPDMPSVDIEPLRLGFRGEVLALQTPACYESIADAEAAVLAVTRVEDNCTADADMLTSVASAGDACSLQVTSTAVDECGNANMDSITVRVDPEAPEVLCDVALNTLSPANHEMINVGFDFTALDICTAAPSVEVFVTSDETTASAEGAGQASPAPDAMILRDIDGQVQGVLLRSERSSPGNGRVYEITVRATDECGNVGSCSATVAVPPNGNQQAVNDGQYFDATKVN